MLVSIRHYNKQKLHTSQHNQFKRKYLIVHLLGKKTVLPRPLDRLTLVFSYFSDDG